ncbi:MAG: recombinase family protein, partial [Victivallales bacterium]
MVYGYIRVSTDKQTVENQRFEIQEFVRKGELKVDAWIEETISGCKRVEERKLGRMLK